MRKLRSILTKLKNKPSWKGRNNKKKLSHASKTNNNTSSDPTIFNFAVYQFWNISAQPEREIFTGFSNKGEISSEKSIL
jgi:hypothetical protein